MINHKKRKTLGLLLFAFFLFSSLLVFTPLKPAKGLNADAKIAFLYHDSQNENLPGWDDFLSSNNYEVTMIQIQKALSSPNILKDYDIIILGNSTNNGDGNMISTQEYALLANQGVPIIANGFGGWIILKLSNFLNYKLYSDISESCNSLPNFSCICFSLR